MVWFIKEGDKPTLRTKISQHWSLLDGTKNWKIAADIKGGEHYHRIISEYQQCPDIMVCSESLMVIIIIELKVPFEPWITESHEYKMAKYEDLCGHICTHRYEAQLYAVVVGARGFPTQSLWALAGRPGLGPRTRCACHVWGFRDCLNVDLVEKGWLWLENSPNCEWTCTRHCGHDHPLIRMLAALT